MAKKNKKKPSESYSGPLPEDNTRTGETDYSPPANNFLEALKIASSLDFLNLNKYNRNKLPPSTIDTMADNTRTGEFNDILGTSTPIPNEVAPVNNALQVPSNVTQSSGGVIPTAPVIPPVPTSPNGMTDLINAGQTAQAQQLGVDPAGMAFINQQKAANLPQTEIGEQGLASLFPGMKHNINVGTYGGSIVGSNPIFVPGGNIMAIDPILEKRKLEEAAKIKAAQDAAKNADFTLRKPKQLQDKFYQESVNKEANALNEQFIKLARDIYGEDAQQVINNPQMFDIGREYLENFDALDLLVEQGDQITTLLADMESQSDAGTQVYDAETWEMNNYIQSQMRGEVKDLVKFREQTQKFQGGKNFDEYLNKKGILDGIQGEILGGTSIQPSEFEGYATLSTSDKTKFDKNIENLLDFYMSNNSPFAEEISKGLLTRDMMEKRLRGSLQNKSQSKSTIANVSPKDSDAGGGTKVTDLDNIDGAPNTKTIGGQTYNMNGELILKTKKGGTFKSSGVTAINSDGTEEVLEGIVEIVPVSMNALDIKEGSASAEGGAVTAGKTVKASTTPTMVARVITYTDEIDPITDKPTGKQVPVTVDKVLKLDETLIKAAEANGGSLGYEKGVIEQGAKKIVGQTKKSGNLAPSEQEVIDKTAEYIKKYGGN
jgi:hypothetical protein